MAEGVYEERSEPGYDGWVDWFMKYGLFLILFAAWFFFRGTMGDVVWDKVSAFSAVIGLVAFAGYGIWDSMKNATPKFVYNDGWCTIDPGESIHQVGNYMVVTPAVRAMGVYWSMRSPVYVTPIDAIKNRGRNLVGGAFFEMVPIEELPPQIAGYIIENGLKPPYYMGLADVDQYETLLDDKNQDSGISKPSVSYLIQQVKESNKLISMLTKQLAEAYNVSEDTIASKMRIMERMRPSELGKALNKVFSDEPGGGK